MDYFDYYGHKINRSVIDTLFGAGNWELVQDGDAARWLAAELEHGDVTLRIWWTGWFEPDGPCAAAWPACNAPDYDEVYSLFWAWQSTPDGREGWAIDFPMNNYIGDDGGPYDLFVDAYDLSVLRAGMVPGSDTGENGEDRNHRHMDLICGIVEGVAPVPPDEPPEENGGDVVAIQPKLYGYDGEEVDWEWMQGQFGNGLQLWTATPPCYNVSAIYARRQERTGPKNRNGVRTFEPDPCPVHATVLWAEHNPVPMQLANRAQPADFELVWMAMSEEGAGEIVFQMDKAERYSLIPPEGEPACGPWKLGVNRRKIEPEDRDPVLDANIEDGGIIGIGRAWRTGDFDGWLDVEWMWDEGDEPEPPPDPDPEPEPEPDPDPEPDPEPELPDDNWAALFERLDKMIELMEKEWGEL